ncbi:STAS domain-containing protein [bacterium]|nr:STAS domain-containing protein [bacterium]
MQFVQVSEIFKNIGNLYNSEFETAKNIMLDFSNVENIDLKGIKTLLNIQKVALMNNKSVVLQNVAPNVGKILDVTGLYKTFSIEATNPILRK